MSWVKDNVIDPITGKTGADAAKEAARIQGAAGQQAVGQLQDASAQAQTYLSPYSQYSQSVLPQLANTALNQPTVGNINLGALQSPTSYNAGNLPNPILSGGQQINPNVTAESINPMLDYSPERVLNDPFYQAQLAEGQANQMAAAAAGGKVNSGQNRDALARQQLLLGNEFRQQDLANQQAQFGQQYNLRGQNIGLGQQNVANQLNLRQQNLGLGQQNYANQANNIALGQGILAQNLQNELAARSQLGAEQQQNISNQLAAQQQGYNQLFNLAGLGANVAGQQANTAYNTGLGVGNLLTGIGNTQAAGQVGAAQARSGALGGLLTLGGQLGSAALLGG